MSAPFPLDCHLLGGSEHLRIDGRSATCSARDPEFVWGCDIDVDRRGFALPPPMLLASAMIVRTNDGSRGVRGVRG